MAQLAAIPKYLNFRPNSGRPGATGAESEGLDVLRAQFRSRKETRLSVPEVPVGDTERAAHIRTACLHRDEQISLRVRRIRVFVVCAQDRVA